MYNKLTKFDENRWSHFSENENLKKNLCELPLILREDRKQENRARDICKETLDIEFERDWSVGLGATLGEGQKIKNYFSSFRDFFFREKPIVSYCWASNVL